MIGGVPLSPYFLATRSDFLPPKRTHAVVTVVRIVVVQTTVRIDIANIVGVRRVRRGRAYPKSSILLNAVNIISLVAIPPSGSHTFDFYDKPTPVCYRFHFELDSLKFVG